MDSRLALVFTMTKKPLPTARCVWIIVENPVNSHLVLVFIKTKKALLTARCAHRKVLAEEGAGLVVVGEQDGYFIVAL